MADTCTYCRDPMLLIVAQSHHEFIIQVHCIASEKFSRVQFLQKDNLQYFAGSNFMNAHDHASINMLILRV